MLIVPLTIELVAHVANAYADWEVEIYRLHPAIFITTVLLYRLRCQQL